MSRPFALALLLLALPGLAASALEDRRAEASSAREKTQQLRRAQAEGRKELSATSTRIEELKKAEGEGLRPSAELEGLLRRSQELSQSLTELSSAYAAAEAAQTDANAKLAEVLTAELEAKKARFDATQDRAERQGLIASMRALRAERDRVRAALPSAQVPELKTAGREEDPEDLLERADALRDAQDKLQKKMAALQTRIVEVKEERELDRRMNDFLGEESLFDEGDRRIRLRKDAQARVSVDPQPPLAGGGTVAAEAAADPAGGGAGTAAPGNFQDSNGDRGKTATAGDSAGPAENLAPRPYTVNRAQDSRPQVGAVRGNAILDPELEDLPSLEAELARMKKAQGELSTKARELEQKARELQ